MDITRQLDLSLVLFCFLSLLSALENQVYISQGCECDAPSLVDEACNFLFSKCISRFRATLLQFEI